MRTFLENIDVNLIKAEKCKRSFYFFVREFLEIVEPNHKSFVWNWHIEYLCQLVQENVFDYLNNKNVKPINLNICPGMTKSTIFSRLLTPWLWTVSPSLVTINVSRSSSNVKNFGLASKEIIESEKYKKYFPHIKIKHAPDSVNYFQNSMGGTRYGYTTNSKDNTGKHADVIIFDDAQSWTDMYSQKEIEQTERGIDGFLSREKRKGKSILINVMQRLGKRDATAYIFEGYGENSKKYNEYINVCLPAELNELVYPYDLREKYIDGFLDPIRLGKEIIEKEKQKFGLLKYEPQYNQYVETQEGLMYDRISWYENKINAEDFINPNTYRASFTDTADGGDYWCTLILCIKDKKIYVVDLIYQKDEIEKSQDQTIEALKKWKCHLNYVEINKEQVTVRKMKKAGVRGVKAAWHNTQKTVRIESVAQFFKHIHWSRYMYDTDIIYKSFVDHLIKYPKNHVSENGHDDPEDVVSMALNFINIKFNYLFDESN